MKERLVKVSLLCVVLFLIGLMFTGQSRAAIDPKSFVGIWLFDDGKGNVATDSKGKHNGELKGDVKWVKGKFGQALEFPGVNDNCVEVPHDDSLTLETFSFVMWTKQQLIGNYQCVLIKTADGMTENYSGYLMDSSKVFWTRFTSGGAGQWGFQKFGTTKISDENWHHLAGTYDKKSVKSYVDGVVEADAPFSGVPDESPGPLSIGDCPGFPYPVKGIIDDVGLFNAALSADEIKTIMTEGLGVFAAVSPSGKTANVWGNIKRGM